MYAEQLEKRLSAAQELVQAKDEKLLAIGAALAEAKRQLQRSEV